MSESSAAKKTVQQFKANVQAYSDETDLLVHAQTMAIMCHGLIQGIAGKEHADQFMAAALADKDRTVITPKRIQ